MADTGFLDKLLDILPRSYLEQIAEQLCNVHDAKPKVRSALKSRMLAADSPALRRTLAIWVAEQLKVESLD